MSFNNNNDAAGSKRRGEEGVGVAAATKVQKTSACVDAHPGVFMLGGFGVRNPVASLQWLEEAIRMEKDYKLTREEIERVARNVDSDPRWVELVRGRHEHLKALRKHVGGLAREKGAVLKLQEVGLESVSLVQRYAAPPRYEYQSGWTFPKEWGGKSTRKWQHCIPASYPDVAVVCRVLCNVYEWAVRKHDDDLGQSPRVGGKYATAFKKVNKTRSGRAYCGTYFRRNRATALGAARAVAVSFWDPSAGRWRPSKWVKSMVEQGLTPLHYQKQLLTQTIMEDEEGNSMLKSKEYLSHEFLKKAVFGVQNWETLHERPFSRSGEEWGEAGASLMGLPAVVLDARVPPAVGLEAVRLPRLEGFGEEQLREAMFDFLRLLPWGHRYTTRGVPVLPELREAS